MVRIAIMFQRRFHKSQYEARYLSPRHTNPLPYTDIHCKGSGAGLHISENMKRPLT